MIIIDKSFGYRENCNVNCSQSVPIATQASTRLLDPIYELNLDMWIKLKDARALLSLTLSQGVWSVAITAGWPASWMRIIYRLPWKPESTARAEIGEDRNVSFSAYNLLMYEMNRCFPCCCLSPEFVSKSDYMKRLLSTSSYSFFCIIIAISWCWYYDHEWILSLLAVELCVNCNYS